jgi:hypothetical protein
MTAKKYLHGKSSQVFSLCLPCWESHMNGGFGSPVEAAAQDKSALAEQNSVKSCPHNIRTAEPQKQPGRSL